MRVSGDEETSALEGLVDRLMPDCQELFDHMDAVVRYLERCPGDRESLLGLATGIGAVADVLGLLGAAELERLHRSVGSLLELTAAGETTLTPSIVTLLLEATGQSRDYLVDATGGIR